MVWSGSEWWENHMNYTSRLKYVIFRGVVKQVNRRYILTSPYKKIHVIITVRDRSEPTTQILFATNLNARHNYCTRQFWIHVRITVRDISESTSIFLYDKGLVQYELCLNFIQKSSRGNLDGGHALFNYLIPHQRVGLWGRHFTERGTNSRSFSSVLSLLK